MSVSAVPQLDLEAESLIVESCALGGDRPKPSLSMALLVTLALLAAMAPFATDLYLPAFPMIAAQLATSAAGVQFTLTAFLVGAALGQLVFGPLSDRVGRVWPIVIGSAVCALASAGAALAPTLSLLVAARFVQGLAASAGMVVGRAIVSDLAEDPSHAARAFNVMMTVIGVAPIVAPWLGSLIVGSIGWRGSLWVLFGLAVVTVGAVCAFVRESRSPADRRAHPASQLSALLSRQFLGYTFAFGLAFSVMMAYISASPFLFQTIIGLSVLQYGMLFAGIALILAVVGAISAHLSARISARRLLRLGLYGVTAGSLAVGAIVFLGGPPMWTIVPIAVAVGSLGFILGNATSLALAAVPRAVGAGSAALGALQFGVGAAVAPLVGIAGDRSVVPLAGVMMIASILALASFLIAERPKAAL